MDTVVLKSSDGVQFSVQKSLATQSKVIREILDRKPDETSIVLPSISSDVLAKLIEFWTWRGSAHGSLGATDTVAAAWKADFLVMNFDLLWAVNDAAGCLGDKAMIDFLREAVAKMVDGLTIDQVNAYFGVVSEYSDDDDDAINEPSSDEDEMGEDEEE